MSKIIIVLNSHNGHITKVFTSDPNLIAEVVDIDTEAEDPVWGPYDPGVTTVVSVVDAAATAYIKEQVPEYQHEQEQIEDIPVRFTWMKPSELWPYLAKPPAGSIACVPVVSDPCRLFLASVLQRDEGEWVASLILDGVHKRGQIFSIPVEAQDHAEREIIDSLRACDLLEVASPLGSFDDAVLHEVAALLLTIFLDEEMQIAHVSHYEGVWVVVCVSESGALFEDYVFGRDNNGYLARRLPTDRWDVQQQKPGHSFDREDSH